MNKPYILLHLKEAAEALSSIVRELEQDPDYEFGNFLPDMSHLYHHINTAWNARDASDSRVEECTEEDFRTWRAMPSSDELLLSE